MATPPHLLLQRGAVLERRLLQARRHVALQRVARRRLALAALVALARLLLCRCLLSGRLVLCAARLARLQPRLAVGARAPVGRTCRQLLLRGRLVGVHRVFLLLLCGRLLCGSAGGVAAAALVLAALLLLRRRLLLGGRAQRLRVACGRLLLLPKEPVLAGTRRLLATLAKEGIERGKGGGRVCEAEQQGGRQSRQSSKSGDRGCMPLVCLPATTHLLLLLLPRRLGLLPCRLLRLRSVGGDVEACAPALHGIPCEEAGGGGTRCHVAVKRGAAAGGQGRSAAFRRVCCGDAA